MGQALPAVLQVGFGARTSLRKEGEQVVLATRVSL